MTTAPFPYIDRDSIWLERRGDGVTVTRRRPLDTRRQPASITTLVRRAHTRGSSHAERTGVK